MSDVKNDKEIQEQQMPTIMENGVLFIGEDESYWEQLISEFKTYKTITFDFERIYESDPTKIQDLIPYVFERRPRIIFIDHSKNLDEMLHLLRVLLRMNFITPPFIVPLVNYKQGTEVLKKTIIAGAQCAHIKSLEINVVVFQAISFMYNELVEDHGFATCKLNDESCAFIAAKLSYIDSLGACVESNLSLEKGSKRNLLSFWKENNILKTGSAKLVDAREDGLYYHYKFVQKFNFDFVSPPLVDEGISEEELQKIKSDFITELKNTKLAYLNWMKNNEKLHSPKLLKTLVIDKKMSFYQNHPTTDSYPFVLRCWPFLFDSKKDLLKIYPHLIIFNFETEEEEQLKNSDGELVVNENGNRVDKAKINTSGAEEGAHTAYLNDQDALKSLVKNIRSIEDYNPFVLIFNYDKTTDEARKLMNYKNILCYKQNINTEIVQKAANSFNSKLSAKDDGSREDIIVFKKHEDFSSVEIEIDLTFIACSEMDVYFNSEDSLSIGTVLRVSYPANFYLTVCPAPKKEKAKADYYGIVCGIGEVELMNYRKFINSVFFRQKEAARLAESEEFERKKAEFKKAQKTEIAEEDTTEESED